MPAIQHAVPADWRDGRGAWRRRGSADPEGLRRSGAASTRDGAAAGARSAALRRAEHGSGARATAAGADGPSAAGAGRGAGDAALDRALRRAGGGGAMSAGRPRLDIDATRERLLTLGCSHAAEQLDPLLTEAVREEVPPHAFLDRLLVAELSGREGRRGMNTVGRGHWR